MKVQIPFQQLLALVKTLTPAQKSKLQQQLVAELPDPKDKSEFIEYLINGPVYTKKEIDVIEKNRISISKWRTKK